MREHVRKHLEHIGEVVKELRDFPHHAHPTDHQNAINRVATKLEQHGQSLIEAENDDE